MLTIVGATVTIGYSREYSAQVAADALRRRMHIRVRAFEKTDSPDLIVRYHANVTQDIANREAEDKGNCEECWPEVYDQGTLSIDPVDARTNRLVWRGWAKGSIDGVIDDQEWMEQRIDEAVVRIVRELPHPIARDPSR